MGTEGNEKHTMGEYADGYAKGLEDAAKLAEGWPTHSAGDDYQTDGSKFWDAGNNYDQGRIDAAAAIRHCTNLNQKSNRLDRSTVMQSFVTPTCVATSKQFIFELGAAGLLYHPEDRADDCLRDHNLDAETLASIQEKMDAASSHLSDSCAVALEVLNGSDPETC
ncbi:hypothetical protein [Pseudovibrio sp. Ad37]|uniref:hypothetical protein n=1 Tax=Pseudovibrio sp. Ad37 TaxID=989422 RepID=UPI0007AE7E6A|nr:hypothetical protein [Pseudovibrio sp. Ad37]KZL24245.1 hypothetical protein PsAD37_02816 [Pseudovibrio sp. Ad37]